MKKGLILAAALLPLSGAIAAEKEHEEHGAHEHGHGKFNVAIEGNTLAMELMAPGADIVGFEHEAKSDKDKKAIAKAKKTLSDVAKVVELPAGAGCSLTSVKAEVHREEDHDDHAHGEKHEDKHDDHAHEKKDDDHAHDHKKEEKHDDHAHEKKDDDHAHDHKHDEKHAEKDGEEHGEFHVDYQLNCKSPEKLTAMNFTYFATFKGAEELDVTVIGPKKQSKFEVNRGSAKIALGGIM